MSVAIFARVVAARAAVFAAVGRHALVGYAATPAEQAAARTRAYRMLIRVASLVLPDQLDAGKPRISRAFSFPRCPGGSQRVPNGCQRAPGSASDSKYFWPRSQSRDMAEAMVVAAARFAARRSHLCLWAYDCQSCSSGVRESATFFHTSPGPAATIASCSGTNGFGATFGRSSFGGELLSGLGTTFRRSSFGGEMVTGFGTTFGRSSVGGKVVTDRSSSVRASAGRPSRAGPAVFVWRIRRAGIEPAPPLRRVTSRSARPRSGRSTSRRWTRRRTGPPARVARPTARFSGRTVGASQRLFQHTSLPTGMPGGPAMSAGEGSYTVRTGLFVAIHFVGAVGLSGPGAMFPPIGPSAKIQLTPQPLPISSHFKASAERRCAPEWPLSASVLTG
jgi:hypothetical protein